MIITFSKGEHEGKRFEYSSSTVTIGREEDNILCLETGGVSRYHALISCASGNWNISDLNSTNGIKVNGTKTQTSKITDGDIITIGEHSFIVSGLTEEAPEENVLEKFQTPLFASSDSGTKEKKEVPDKTKGKKIFSNRLYYTILACVAIIVITTAVKLFSNSGTKADSKSISKEEQIETIIFERVKYFNANIFRFSMKLNGTKAVFTIDDAATERHSKEITIDAPDGIELLKTQILASGIMNKKPNIQPGSRDTYTRIVLISDRNCVDYPIYGEALPDSLADIYSAIDEFAENCGMITVSRTSEEIMQIATDNFTKAEDLFSNFEASPENLRDAIAKYKIAERYLSQYSPPPPMAAKAKKQLARAEQLRNKLFEELKLEETRCLDSNQLDELRGVYKKMMMLCDPATKSFDRIKRKLFKLDRALSKMGSRK